MTSAQSAPLTRKLPATAETVVVGGGLAGAAAACVLARAGREVLVLEREASAAHKMCGDFLSTETQGYLRRLGVDLDAFGGHVTTHVRLVCQKHIVETALPFTGLGVSRFLLDEALLDRARQNGAQLWRGQRAGVTSHDDALVIDFQGAGSVRTKTLFLATGKQDMRGLRRQPAVFPEDLVGFKMYFDVNAAQRFAMAGHVELILFRHGYAGLQRVEGGQVNLCLLVERNWLMECGGTWQCLLHALLRCCPHLQRRLWDATPLLAHPLSIYRVPYGFVYQPPVGQGGDIYRLGDQVGVIPSFSGDGMGIALHSGVLAAGHYLSGLDAGHYHRRILQDITGQIGRAGMIYRASRWGPGQRLLMGWAGMLPQTLKLAARLTRVPPPAVARAMRFLD